MSTRQLLDILSWLDINRTTTCCIKTLRHLLLVLEVLVCLVGVRIDEISLIAAATLVRLSITLLFGVFKFKHYGS
jgi:hypothetical protein